MRVKVEKVGINGEGIAFQNRQPIFIDGAIPQEVVEIKIIDQQRKYARAQIVKVIEKSNDRCKPACMYAKDCGACAVMHMRYEKQLECKYDSLRESLIKYAQVNPRKISKVVRNKNVLGYRNSFKLPFAMYQNTLVCGLYKPNTNFFIPIETCMVHEIDLERVKKALLKVLNKYNLKAYDYKTKKGLRTLIVRGFNQQYQVCIVSGDNQISEECIQDCMQIEGITSLWQSIHTIKKTVDLFGKTMVHLAGDRLLSFTLEGLNLRVSPKSFFQLNTLQAQNLYRIAADLVDDNQNLIVEAYSGIGAMSLYLKDKAKEIIGIEYVSDAVANANQNAKRNKADHVSFVCGDAAEKLTGLAKKKNIDVLVVDPPRSGLDDNMLGCILKSKVKNLIYISCNPSTLGKNIAVLQDKYVVEKVIPVDMFSQTPHIESVVKLVRR